MARTSMGTKKSIKRKSRIKKKTKRVLLSFKELRISKRKTIIKTNFLSPPKFFTLGNINFNFSKEPVAEDLKVNSERKKTSIVHHYLNKQDSHKNSLSNLNKIDQSNVTNTFNSLVKQDKLSNFNKIDKSNANTAFNSLVKHKNPSNSIQKETVNNLSSINRLSQENSLSNLNSLVLHKIDKEKEVKNLGFSIGEAGFSFSHNPLRDDLAIQIKHVRDRNQSVEGLTEHKKDAKKLNINKLVEQLNIHVHKNWDIGKHEVKQQIEAVLIEALENL